LTPRINYDMFTHESESARGSLFQLCYRSWFEGLLKVTASHVGLHCKCGSILETMQGRVTVTMDH